MIFQRSPSHGYLAGSIDGLVCKRFKLSPKTFVPAVVMLIYGSFVGCSGPDASDVGVLFENVAVKFDIQRYIGTTYGAAWGDFDADGLPDLYLTNHLSQAQLFRNMSGTGFSDVTGRHFAFKDVEGDKHGAAWADFNNDGYLDLVQLTGAGRGLGSEPKYLFRNDIESFTAVGESAGVANLFGRTRMPLWIDIDRDGKLDIFHGAEARLDDRTSPFFFKQTADGEFIEADNLISFASGSVPFCILTELTNDSHAELICRVAGKGQTAQIFDTAILPAQELNLLPQTAFEDIAAGDFDNDGLVDLFLTRTTSPGAVTYATPTSNTLIVDLLVDERKADAQAGFSFNTTGEVTFHVADMTPPNVLSPSDVFIGANGYNPADVNFVLSSETAGVAVPPDFSQRNDGGVYIAMTALNEWRVLVKPAKDGKKNKQFAIKMDSTRPINDIEIIGSETTSETAPARLFMNQGGKLVEESEKRGVNRQAVSGYNVVAGDFDNDMDLDLFVLTSGLVGKHENQLLLNRGDGYFSTARRAGGAAGSLSGVGDSVTTADFDGDGFLDLLTATGGSMGRSLGFPSETGRYQLYRNVGNDNHWLEIDLVGKTSNRDGIGAKIFVRAGDVTQVRIQDGGVHHRGQNHSRLHFGLADHANVDKITVHWPSGLVQELSGTEADQVLTIHENE